jgi:hypothetical protein
VMHMCRVRFMFTSRLHFVRQHDAHTVVKVRILKPSSSTARGANTMCITSAC